MSEKRYTASDVENIIGMDRNALFYCAKTLGLIKPIQKKQKVTLYDFRNLLDLALVHEFRSLGITQGAIRRILDRPLFKFDEKVWDIFHEHRGVFEGKGCFLVLQRQNKVFWSITATFDGAVNYLHEQTLDKIVLQPPPPIVSLVIVDILGLIRRIERSTGERLGRK